MNRFASLLICVLAMPPAIAGEAGEEPLEQAGSAVASFGKALKSTLVQAMQSGGPLAAISVCNTEAPAIAEAVSLEQGMRVSRVSLKIRNPGNAPNTWQSEVLKSFEARKQAGEKAADLSWHETVTVGGQQEFRFMKAIPTGGLCLQCHGSDIQPEVTQKLAELYPEDQATGFSAGDLRGAFVVTKTLP